VVVVVIDRVCLAYCSHDWLAVKADGFPASAAISWVHDNGAIVRELRAQAEEHHVV
jgi:hypothetical protein